MLGDQTFKDTGKLEYGDEIGRMVMSDGYTCEEKKEGISTCTAALAMDLLFKHVGPDLLEEDCISELIARAYTWDYRTYPYLPLPRQIGRASCQW